MNCLHCDREIREWPEATLAFRRKTYIHPDLVDVNCSGIHCLDNESDEPDSEATPETAVQP